MILPDCIHRHGEYRGAVECGSNRLVPLPPPGKTIPRPAETCLVCPYAQRPNLDATTLRDATAIAATVDLTAADFPCVHRGDVLAIRECQLCGSRGKMFDVHACAVHGECSVQTRQRGLQACVACEDQQPQ